MFRPRLSASRHACQRNSVGAFKASQDALYVRETALKPVIVGGLPHERGVASTCNYEARRYGVHSGMPLRKAYQLCPNGLFIRGNYQVYQAFSEKFFRILHEYTPDVEEASLDEAYLDFTRCRPLYSSFSAVARQMKARIEKATGLKVSVGMAPNKILAKLATKKAKPAGFFEVEEGCEEEFLRGLGIESLPGIGPKAQVVLRMLNIHKIGDLWGMPRPALRSLFGLEGEEVYLQSRGIPKAQARLLVVRGFFAELLTKVKDEATRERLAAAIESDLEEAE